MAPYSLEIPKGPFTTLVADPPWPFNDRLPGPGRGAAKHYECMSLREIEDMWFPLMEVVADNAHLYLWAPNAFIADAWDVAEEWDFEPKTLLTWVKVTKDAAEQIAHEYEVVEMKEIPSGWKQLNSKGVVRVGMGRGFRNCTEHVIVAVRGKLDYLRKDVPNVFFAPRGAHSVKPDIFYSIVESMSPGPYLELFAGRERPGWTCLVPPKGDPHEHG